MAHPRDRARWSDARLLAGVADCDDRAFTAFYRRHLALVVSVLMRRTGDPELAADLTAEVFAAAMQAAGRYEPHGDSAAGWLIGIARNVLGHSLRRGRVDSRARERLGMEALELGDADLERVLALADAGTGPATQLLGTLPEPEQAALVARVIDERPYAEVAATLGCSELVARKRVSRGLARLRSGLAGA
jgi:RNA polymerase sigma-70 factor (ECF subfamily)